TMLLLCIRILSDIYCFMVHLPRRSAIFPYTTLFRSFLLLVLPLWGMKLPYTAMLITLTFVGGLIPIVGNLICNSVITVVGLSVRSEEHTSELQSRENLVCRLLLEKKNKIRLCNGTFI